MNSRGQMQRPALWYARWAMPWLALAGCGDRGGDPDRTMPSYHAALVREAVTSYTFAAPKPAIAGEATSIGPARQVDSTDFTAAEASRVDSPDGTRPRELLARFRIGRAYPRLGLAEGDNYVWAIPAIPPRGQKDTVHRKYVMVPADTMAPMHYLELDETKVLTGHRHQAPEAVVAAVGPSSVVFGVCLEGPMCPAGHCGIVNVGRRYTGEADRIRLAADSIR